MAKHSPKKTFVNRWRSYFRRKTAPQGVTRDDGLRYWQEKLVQVFVFACSFLGVFVYLPSVTLAIVEGLWLVALADTVLYGWVLFLFFTRSISFEVRAISITLLSYLVGIVLLGSLGPFGGGPVWLFVFPVIVALLLGLRASIAALGINLLTIVTVGLLLHMGFMDWGCDTINPVQKWIVISLNFLLLNSIVTIAFAVMSGGIEDLLTQQRSLMLSLEESQNRFKKIFEFAPDAYYLSDLEGTLLDGNRAAEELLGYEKEELIGRNFIDLNLLPPEHLSRALEFLQMNIDGKGTGPDEFSLVRKDGERILAEISTFPTEVGGEKIVLGIARDVSERKQLEKRLHKAQRMEVVGTLAGGVAHDLNNILSGIVSYPELVLMDLPEDSHLRDPIQTIRRSGQRAATVVQDLLTLARRGVTISELVSLNDIISMQMKSPEFEKLTSFHPAVSIKTRLEPELQNIRCSSVHLAKSIMNLVSNAAEAMPGGGEIGITTQNRYIDLPIRGYDRVDEGEYAVLSISDTGIGISNEDMEHIFEPFYTKKVMGRSGTGLGMAVVWGTVKDHKGYVDVESQEGQGTTFTLYFPSTRDSMIPKKSEIPIERYTGAGESVLVVDDIAEQREIASRMLEKIGYVVRTAASGEDAEAYLTRHAVDLVVLDMIMEPGIDGLETYRRILERHPGQKAIIVSGFSETERVKELQKLGAGKYIKKPYTLEKLGCAVREELDRA